MSSSSFFVVASLVFDNGSGMLQAGFPRSGPSSSAFGWYGPEGQFHGLARYVLAGFDGDDAFHVVFPSVFGRLVMLGIMAGMAQKGFFKFVDIPFVVQRQIPMVQTSLQTTEIPQLPFVFRCSMSLLCLPFPLLSTTGVSGLDFAVYSGGPAVAVDQGRRQFPVVVQRPIPMVLMTMEIPQLQFIDTVIDVCCAGPANSGATVRRHSRSHSCSSSSSLDNVVDIPIVAQLQIPLVRLPQRFSSCSTLIRWSTFVVQVQFSSAVVEETAELPQLQFLVVWSCVQRQVPYGR